MDNMNINIGIIGAVSAGKSTLLNTIFVGQYTDMKMKRTTAVPQIYHETTDVAKYSNLNNIKQLNRVVNEDIMNRTEKDAKNVKYEDIKEQHYNVPKVYDFVKLKDGVNLNIYDLPGLDDSKIADLYFKYVADNFHKLDIIIYVLDIHVALNRADDVKILELILNGIKQNKETKLVVLLNKCDEIEFKDGICIPSDEEMREVADQAKNIINAHILKICGDIKYDIMPISSEDSYIYRIIHKHGGVSKLEQKYIDKFGVNEIGKSTWKCSSPEKKTALIQQKSKFDYGMRMKQTGFQQLKDKMLSVLKPENQYKFIIRHLNQEMELITHNDIDNIDVSATVNKFGLLKDDLTYIQAFFGVAPDYTMFENNLRKFADNYTNKHVANNVVAKRGDGVISSIISYFAPNDTNISKYYTIKDSFTKLLNNFGVLKQDTFDDCYKNVSEINTTVNQYHVQQLANISDEKKIIHHLDKLRENKYKDVCITASNCLSNLVKREVYIKDDKLDAEKMICFIDILDERYINGENMTVLLLEMLLDIYMYHESNLRSPNVTHDNKLYDQLERARFWKNAVVKYDCVENKYINIINSMLEKNIIVNKGDFGSRRMIIMMPPSSNTYFLDRNALINHKVDLTLENYVYDKLIKKLG